MAEEKPTFSFQMMKMVSSKRSTFVTSGTNTETCANTPRWHLVLRNKPQQPQDTQNHPKKGAAAEARMAGLEEPPEGPLQCPHFSGEQGEETDFGRGPEGTPVHIGQKHSGLRIGHRYRGLPKT